MRSFLSLCKKKKKNNNTHICKATNKHGDTCFYQRGGSVRRGTRTRKLAAELTSLRGVEEEGGAGDSLIHLQQRPHEVVEGWGDACVLSTSQ